MIPQAKLESAPCYLKQLAMRNFDVKKNCFIRKDLNGQVGRQNSLLPGGVLKGLKKIRDYRSNL
jgi:hypothetical protein